MARTAERVHVRAPGKVNVFFAVGDLQDDGYHDVASAYQAVSLYEDVWAEHASDFSITVSGEVDVSDVPTDDRNLALRAARLLAAELQWDGGVHLDVHKSVPVAGGMGGGSADAAAALLACDVLWGGGLSSHELQRLGSRLGADIPFALMGGTAIGTGRGDELSPALVRGRFDWVLVTQAEGMSTPQVYRELDELRSAQDIVGTTTVTVPVDVLHALRAGDSEGLAAVMDNHLQTAAVHLRPELGAALTAADRAGALGGLVSGSGPTVALLAASEEAAMDLQVTLSASGYTAIRAHGPVPGARVISG